MGKKKRSTKKKRRPPIRPFEQEGFGKKVRTNHSKGRGKRPMRAEFLRDLEASEETLDKIRKLSGVHRKVQMQFTVFKVKYGGKTLYMCLSGGEQVDGEIQFTPIGQGSLEAMCSLKRKDERIGALIIRQLKLGSVPLEETIREIFEEVPEHSMICFYGDMAGELDGHILPLFELS